MVIDVYAGGIGVPAKCGSRYFSKTVPDLGEPHRYSFREFYMGDIKLNWIIIRNPLSHLESALQTEVMECWDDSIEIEKILKSFINSYNGGTHFYPHFCEKVYDIWCRSGYSLGIVDLSKLSEFVSSILYDIPFKQDEFDFNAEPTYKPKKEVWNKCVDLFPELMDKLIRYTQSDMKYYNALLNKDKSLIKII